MRLPSKLHETLISVTYILRHSGIKNPQPKRFFHPYLPSSLLRTDLTRYLRMMRLAVTQMVAPKRTISPCNIQDKKTSLDTLPARRDAVVPIRVGQRHTHKSWYDSVFCWNRNWNHKYPILEPIPVQQKNLISAEIGIRIINFWKLERERERWSEGREGTERSTIKREGGKSCKEEREEEMKRPNSKSEIRKRRVGSQKQNRTRSCSTARFDSDFHPHSYSHTHPI